MAASADNLLHLQRRFFSLITAPQGVAPGLRALAGQDPGIAPLHGWIDASDEAAAIERLDVYADMYFFRLLEALQHDYPKLASLVGAANFHNLVTDYLLVHPSRYASIRHIGRHLPEFIQGHALTKTWPELPDLAQLEWARGEVFDAANATPLEAAELATIQPESWAELRFGVIPAVRILDLQLPADAVWLAIERGEPQPQATAEPFSMVVFRNGLIAYHRRAAQGEAAALRALRAGGSFGELCASLEAEHGEAAAPIAFSLLKLWLDDGLLCSFYLPPA